MDWIFGIFAPIVGGAIAASGFIISKKPDAEQYLKKLAPYQGGIGVAMLVVGIYKLLDTLGHWGYFFRAGFGGIVAFATLILLVVVGFLLGFGLIAQWIPGEGDAEKKAVEIQRKLITYQVPLGIAAIACGVINFLNRLF